jgi:ABC-type sugar transport system ATPase subunit
MDDPVVLKAKGITKGFPGVQALKHVDFDLKRGEVHALVGENGAGKSTLMNILSGVLLSDEGYIEVEGKKCCFKDPYEAAQAGIGIVFQELSLIQNLSVAENIYAGRQIVNALGLVKQRDLYRRSRSLLEIFEEHIDPAMPVKYLSIAKQQVVEILKAISHDPKIVILDEPTSSLTHKEISKLFSIIKRLKGEGISFIYISHHLPEIFRVADRATVLRDGSLISTVEIKDTDEKKIVSLMVGREIIHEHIDRDDRIDRSEPVLQVRNLGHKKYFSDISFDLYRGEILGFAGLVGAGRSEIARTIFGFERRTGGSIILEGKEIFPQNPIDAMQKGIAYTSENRKYDGLFLDMTISENSIAPQLKKFSNQFPGFMNEKEISRFVDNNIQQFNIQTSSKKASLRKLSGGNQQKVLLSMWLGIKPKVLIVDEPTKGVDIGAKQEIFNLLRSMADSGVAVLVVSSDLLEIMSISDRVVVMKEGHITGILHHDEVTEEKVISYASGVLSDSDGNQGGK